jgi:hypothetical protein
MKSMKISAFHCCFSFLLTIHPLFTAPHFAEASPRQKGLCPPLGHSPSGAEQSGWMQ